MTGNSIEQLVDQMTLEEQVSLLSGADFWSLPAITRLNIGKLRVTDGPNGARGGGSFIGGVKSASFPVGIALGATWNTDLLREIGVALSDEVKSKGAHVLLGPTINLHRSVTNGRNFECYSEDPELTGALAGAYVQGLQSRGIAATLKHFAGNESEIQRTTISSDIDERSLRELYLRPFELGVKAGAWAIMSSYNKLNDTYAAENPWLLTQVLRDDWGYDGVVMSDWFGSRTTAPTVNAGLDLEMPGPTRVRGATLVEAVHSGEVPAERIRDSALNILRLMERTGALTAPLTLTERSDDRPEHRALIRRAGAEAAVLLKNTGVLPLTKSGTIAVIGPNAREAQIMGGGSAQLNPHYRVSPWDGLVAAVGEAPLTYAIGCLNRRYEPLLTGTFTTDYYASDDLSGPVVHTETTHEAQAFWVENIAEGKVETHTFSARITGTFTPADSGPHRVGLFSAGLSRLRIDGQLVTDAWTDWKAGATFFEEGCDEVIGTVDLTAGHPHSLEIEFSTRGYRNLGVGGYRAGIGLPLGDAEITEAVAAARAADTAVLFVGRTAEWDTEGSDLPNITLPGRQDELIAAVAAANPNTIVVLQTGGPVEMPWIDSVAAVVQAWYPGQECGNAIADVLFGDAEPTGRLSQTFPVRWSDNPTATDDPSIYPGRDGHVIYAEGVFIGYRHYDHEGIAPLFPFGHGLGYTTFDLTDLTATESGGTVTVSVTLTNTGSRPGTSVTQIYVCDPESRLPRAPKDLRAFAKTTLAPGESRTLTFPLASRAFAFYDPDGGGWTLEPGTFKLLAAFSATDIRAKLEISLPDIEVS